jgi:hypothetical protein
MMFYFFALLHSFQLIEISSLGANKKKPSCDGFDDCDPGGIQTPDFQNRNLTFYSAELRGRKNYKDTNNS